ncbi:MULTISPECIES: hypothetical protein [unclassified Streptomyces]|uniref:hypothetical protein n=1 Tax=unclassified Streptomyces TaxID=2593676 RepID=UPI003390C234
MTGVPANRADYKRFVWSLERASDTNRLAEARQQVCLMLAGVLDPVVPLLPYFLLVREDGEWHTVYATLAEAEAEQSATPGLALLTLKHNPGHRGGR